MESAGKQFVGKQFVETDRPLLNAVHEEDVEYAHVASVQLDEVVLAWWDQAVAANMAKPEMVQTALTTCMDTNAVSKMPIGVIAKAVQEMLLSTSQKDMIATAYSTYRNTLIKRLQNIMHQHTEAATNDTSKQEASVAKHAELLGELDACLRNTQQACMAMTTVSTSVYGHVTYQMF